VVVLVPALTSNTALPLHMAVSAMVVTMGCGKTETLTESLAVHLSGYVTSIK
jgi:hypothetical protein